MGLSGAARFWQVYHQGESFYSKDLGYTPFLILMGLGILIEPRILLAGFSDPEHPVPTRFKALAFVLAVVGFGIGLYLRTVVFRDWKRVPLGTP